MGKVAMTYMKKIPLKEFLENWERGLIMEVQTIGSRVYGKSVKGQADNPQGYVLVYADAGEKVEKPWWKFW